MLFVVIDELIEEYQGTYTGAWRLVSFANLCNGGIADAHLIYVGF